MSKRILVLGFLLLIIIAFPAVPGWAQVAALQSFTIAPAQIVGDSTQVAVATVTITRFSCPNCNVQVPISYSPTSAASCVPSPGPIVPVGQDSVTFNICGNLVSQDTVVTFTATLGGSITQSVTVLAPVPTLSITPASFVGFSDQTATGTVTLTAPPLNGAFVALTVSPSFVVTFPNFANVPTGQTSGTFTINGFGVGAPTTATITATYGKSTTAQVTVLPHQLSISVSPSNLFTGGPSATVTVTVQPPFPVNTNTSVTITNSQPFALSAPSNVVFPGGQTSLNFTAFPGSVSQPTTVTLTASRSDSISGSTSVTVSPNPPPAGDLGPCRRCENQAGSPINLTNGNAWVQQRDYSLPGVGGGLELVRTWNSLWPNVGPIELSGAFGHSWRSNYEERLVANGSSSLTYWRGDGNTWQFSFQSSSQSYGLVSPPDERAVVVFDAGTTLYTLTLLDGTKKIFNNSGYLIAVRDRNSNQTTIAYDASNRITQVTDAAGRSITFTYPNATSRQVATVQDAVGVIATYSFDASARLTQVKHADGSFISFNYDASDLLTSLTDTAGKLLESHTYDSSRRGLTSQRANGVDAVSFSYISPTQTQVTDSLLNVTTYAFQPIGSRNFITSVAGPGCASCGGRGNNTFAYDTNGNRTSSTDALGHTTNFTYDPSGSVTSRSVQLDANTTLTSSFTYNGFGQVLTAIDPLGKTTTNTYDLNGNLLSTTTPSPDGVQSGSTTRYAYDQKGQLVTITDPRGNGTTITYTSAGLIASIKDASLNTTSFAYDARANRTSATDALGKTTTFAYDVMNRLTNITFPDASTTSFVSDSRGRRTSVTDGNAKVTFYAYDDADRLISVTDAQANVTRYAYDTENNLTSITDALGRTTSFAFDNQGRVTQATFPSTLRETYAYDAVGNLTSKADRKGQTITYTYDALNRLTRKQFPDTTGVNYTYDAVSRLTQATDPTGTYQFAYDNLGRLTRATTSYAFLTSRSFVVSYGYDAASNRTAVTDPEGGATSYAYDALNRLTSLTNFQGQQFTFSYDALSRRAQLARPNGVNTSYQYDALSRLLSVLHKRGATTIDGASYTVDAVGNRTAKTDLRGNGTSNYTYDAIYQLTQVVQGTTTREAYTYDAVGNRLSSLGVSPYIYNSSNQLTSVQGANFTYDNNGNTQTASFSSFMASGVWDFENRLTSVTLPGGAVVSFKYDPFGRRIQKSSAAGTRIYVYDGDNLLEEVNGTGAVAARYTQGLGIDEPLAMMRGGTTSYYEADGLGSVTSLTSSTGAIAATYTYDSFGNPIAATGAISNPFLYTAREFDLETGLYYYRARYYASGVGTFLSEDSARFASGTYNFYTYVDNSPLNYRDPFGMQKAGSQGSPSCCQENIDIAKKELENALNNAQLMRGRIVKKYKDCLLKFPDMKIKCDTSRSDCGAHNPLAVDTIVVTPLGTMGRKGPCGPLASTFLHEMVHICYNNDLSGKPITGPEQEKEAFGAECEVFGFGCACARDPRKCGYR